MKFCIEAKRARKMMILNVAHQIKTVALDLMNQYALLGSHAIVVFCCMALLITNLTAILIPLSIAAEIIVKYFVHHVFEKLAHHNDAEIHE